MALPGDATFRRDGSNEPRDAITGMSEWDVDIEDPAEAEEDSEPARLRDEIAGRPEAVVLVTRTAAESAAPRLGAARGGAAGERGLVPVRVEAVHGRDVVFVTAETRGRIEWMDSDVSTIAALVPRLGTLTPKGCFVQNPPRDLVEFVNDQRASGTGPQEVAQEAKRSLIEVSALHAQAGKRERGRTGRPCAYGRRPPSEPFPVEVFPEPVAQFVCAVADAVGGSMRFCRACGACYGRRRDRAKRGPSAQARLLCVAGALRAERRRPVEREIAEPGRRAPAATGDRRNAPPAVPRGARPARARPKRRKRRGGSRRRNRCFIPHCWRIS